MRKMRDLFLGAPAFCDILLRGYPSTASQRLVPDLDGAAVGGFDDVVGGLPLRHVAQDVRAELVDIALERADPLAIGDQIAEMQAGPHHVRRQLVHIQIALVAQDDPRVRIVQQQALRHVVDGGIQPFLLERESPLGIPVLL